jgi:hypothetical protein
MSDDNSGRERRPDKRAASREKESQKYFDAIGRLASSWNSLQETLAMIFCNVCSSAGPSDQYNVTLLSIWYSQQSDRSQRRMLRAAVESGALTKNGHYKALPESAADDLIWLIKEADALSARRDEAIHSPMSFRAMSDIDVEIVSAWYFGNPLALRLKNKAVFEELSISTWRAYQLHKYALEIEDAVSILRHPWPSKRLGLSRELHRQQMETNRQQEIK